MQEIDGFVTLITCHENLNACFLHRYLLFLHDRVLSRLWDVSEHARSMLCHSDWRCRVKRRLQARTIRVNLYNIFFFFLSVLWATFYLVSLISADFGIE